jgi:hypothetical protein
MPVTVNEFKLNPLDGSITTEYSDGSVTTGSILPASVLTANDTARIRAAGALSSPRGILADLACGRSATMFVQGDSTGNENSEWFYQLAQTIGAALPDARIEYQLYNPATLQLERKPNVQDGLLGERHRLAPGFIFPVDLPARSSPDLDLRIRVDHPSWTVTAEEVLLSQFSAAAGNRAFRWYLSAGNLPKLAWTTDGTNEVTVTGSAITGLSAGSPIWLRVTLDVDNGAGGYTWAMFTSTDGSTWTAAGGSATSGGVTSVYASSECYQLGVRSTTNAAFTGRIYKAEFRDGILGGDIFPANIDSWRESTTASLAPTRGGSPTLYVVNGSASGQNAAYFTANAARMIPVSLRGCLYFLSTGHNETGVAMSGAVKTTVADIRAWIAAVKARNPLAVGYAVMQNPRNGAIASLASHQDEFVALFADVGESAGLRSIDVWRAFKNDPRGVAALVSSGDGIHPTQGSDSGSSLWASVVWSEINKR